MTAGGNVFASAADAQYGYHLVNLIGSLQANSDVFDRIVAFDLGMSAHQRAWLRAAPAVELRPVPAFVPHWNRGFTWKPWSWTQLEGDAVLWVDAGATILRSLEPVLEQIRERGYFLITQEDAVSDIVPLSFFDLYELPREYASKPYAAAGVVGFRPGSVFFERVIVPTYEDCLRGRNLGFSAREAPFKNRGLGRGPVDVIHDCPHFRWDQSVLNVHLLRTLPDAPLADVNEFAGWRSATDHPEQRIWHHRRRGSLRYLKRLRTRGPRRVVWYVAGWTVQLRWWATLNSYLFDPTAYVLKARKIGRGLLDRLRP